MSRLTWDEYFFKICDVVAERSHDQDTKLGCVIVDEHNRIVSTGFNGLPPGVDDSFWPTKRGEDKPFIVDKNTTVFITKYEVMIHAEVNSILHARQDLSGCRLYVPFIPCSNCAMNIIASNIKEVVVRDRLMVNPKWKSSQMVAVEMFRQAGVAVRVVGV